MDLHRFTRIPGNMLELSKLTEKKWHNIILVTVMETWTHPSHLIINLSSHSSLFRMGHDIIGNDPKGILYVTIKQRRVSNKSQL